MSILRRRGLRICAGRTVFEIIPPKLDLNTEKSSKRQTYLVPHLSTKFRTDRTTPLSMLPSTNDATFEGPGKSPRARRTPARIAGIGVSFADGAGRRLQKQQHNSRHPDGPMPHSCRLLLCALVGNAIWRRHDNGARGALPMPT